MNTFKHSGDLGDIIYSLPTIMLLGGGVLYLDITGGKDDPACMSQCYFKKTKFNRAGYNYLRPLLISQPYIADVRIYNGEKITHNLNNFRNIVNTDLPRNKNKNLLDLHLQTFDLPEWDCNEPWIFVDQPIKLKKNIIVCRSPRYQSSYLWFFSTAHAKLKNEGIFIGLPKEHEIFEYMLEVKIPYHPIKDALELAQILKGCKMFVSNGTSSLAIGIGIGTVSIIQELYNPAPNCIFPNKKNMKYINQ